MSSSSSGRYARTTAQSSAGDHHTLAETESAVSERLADLELDMNSMAAVQNVYRAANAFRNHLESTVLAPHDLTWTGWVVLWVVWIWGDIETRHAATEAGISKGTLTGVVGTLQTRGLLTRRTHPDDARRVLLTLTAKGKRLMLSVFPEFNREEVRLMAALSPVEIDTLTTGLRKAVASLDD
jgi:MarR family transcriptional regulator, organic hydroperoxide resistance regulator